MQKKSELHINGYLIGYGLQVSHRGGKRWQSIAGNEARIRGIGVQTAPTIPGVRMSRHPIRDQPRANFVTSVAAKSVSATVGRSSGSGQVSTLDVQEDS